MTPGRGGNNGVYDTPGREEEEKVVSLEDARARSSRLEEFLDTARRLQEERASAADVAKVIDSTPPAQWPLLAIDARLRTSAAIERLGEEVRRRLDRNPREALSLAELSTTVADSLPVTAYPAVTLAQIQAMAWKDRANALRFLGRYPEAFEAVTHAESILEHHVALGLDRAVVDLVKALTLADVGELEGARSMAMTCGSVFLSHGDLTRALYAGEIEAMVLYEQHKYADSLALYESLLGVARAGDDEEIEARLHSNAGYCGVRLNDLTAANIHFSEAIARWTDRGEVVSATRTQMGVGRLLIGRGQAGAAIRHLESARTAFTRFAMWEEACLCALAIAEARLMNGEEAEARQIVHQAALDFADSPLERRIIDAVSALESAMTAEEPLEALRGVYELIDPSHSQELHS